MKQFLSDTSFNPVGACQSSMNIQPIRLVVYNPTNPQRLRGSTWNNTPITWNHQNHGSIHTVDPLMNWTAAIYTHVTCNHTGDEKYGSIWTSTIPKRKLKPKLKIAGFCASGMVLHQKILNVFPPSTRGARFFPHFCNIRTRSSLSAPISFVQGYSRSKRKFHMEGLSKLEAVNSRGSTTSTLTASATVVSFPPQNHLHCW